jgi:hypothetical protein
MQEVFAKVGAFCTLPYRQIKKISRSSFWPCPSLGFCFCTLGLAPVFVFAFVVFLRGDAFVAFVVLVGLVFTILTQLLSRKSFDDPCAVYRCLSLTSYERKIPPGFTLSNPT